MMKKTTASLLTLVTMLCMPGAHGQTEPIDGRPPLGSKSSVVDLQDQVVYQRAFEAVVWSIPAASIYRFRLGVLTSLGMSDNDIVAYSQPATMDVEALTANNVTAYITAFTDLRNGPVVLEVPAKTNEASLYGQIVDAWQVTIADVGPFGDDKGKGGKYLLVPPAYKGVIPKGYLPIRSESYRIALAFRSIPAPGVPVSAAHAYAQKLKMYPLAEAANPKPTRFVDPATSNGGKPARLPTLPAYDIKALEDIHEFISVEPVRARDKVMMGMLASIGIEPGKPFKPDGKTKAAMERGIVDAYFYMQQRRASVQAANPYWPDRHWSSFLDASYADTNAGFQFETANAVDMDRRADIFFPGTFYPRVMPKRAATAYLVAGADSRGKALEAGKTYRLRLPKDVPVDQFWALIVYDQATYAFIYNPQNRVGLSSRDLASMKRAGDGGVDLYFGPKAPAGMESNWISTEGKVPWPVLRLYGPQEAYWTKTFKLPDVEVVE